MPSCPMTLRLRVAFISWQGSLQKCPSICCIQFTGLGAVTSVVTCYPDGSKKWVDQRPVTRPRAFLSTISPKPSFLQVITIHHFHILERKNRPFLGLGPWQSLPAPPDQPWPGPWIRIPRRRSSDRSWTGPTWWRSGGTTGFRDPGTPRDPGGPLPSARRMASRADELQWVYLNGLNDADQLQLRSEDPNLLRVPKYLIHTANGASWIWRMQS